ncbi:MAG: N-acetylmuramic acid 6-phosphate etherase [Rhodobacter sp.]|nr:N-acetylmuramic acid 6-phosphate etherase [Rhodobacter sp.]
MPQPKTEARHDHARGLDALPDQAALRLLLTAQREALETVSTAIPDIAEGAALMEAAIRGGGRLIYAGAGSSALMGNADGMELAGTFGIDPARVLLCMAGGLPQNASMPGDTEDNLNQADTDAAQVRPGDVVIAITASGSTPYAVQFARLSRAAGGRVIGIANNRNAPLFDFADVAICLPTPPEMIAGSTRMGAGTAQKAALNMMSTLMGIRLGHVHDGMMVNVRADNDKLRARAVAMVQDISGAPADAARAELEARDWNVKAAALGLAGVDDPVAQLDRHQGRLRAALPGLQDKDQTDNTQQTTMERTR